MERKEQKRVTRKQRSINNRHDKLISQYVRFKYPEVYADAEACYTRLNARYPDKRDLSKTIEYVQLTTGAITYSQYYNHRKQEKKSRNKGETAGETEEKTTTGQDVVTDNMVLQIPLLHSDTVANNLSLNIPQHEEVMVEIMNDSVLHAVFNNFTTPDGETLDTSGSESMEVTSHHAGESFLGVPEQAVQDLPREHVKDPELGKIFHDMETELEDLVSDYANQTPLEGESFLDVPEQAVQDLARELVKDPELGKIFHDMETELEDLVSDYANQTPLEKELSDIGW